MTFPESQSLAQSLIITASKKPVDKELAKKFHCISFYYTIQTFRLYAKLEKIQRKANEKLMPQQHVRIVFPPSNGKEWLLSY